MEIPLHMKTASQCFLVVQSLQIEKNISLHQAQGPVSSPNVKVAHGVLTVLIVDIIHSCVCDDGQAAT